MRTGGLWDGGSERGVWQWLLLVYLLVVLSYLLSTKQTERYDSHALMCWDARWIQTHAMLNARCRRTTARERGL